MDANTRTVINPDGSQTTELSPGPINFRRADGSWAPIDTHVTPVGESGTARGAGDNGDTSTPPAGWRNTADAVDVRLAAQAGSAGMVQIGVDSDHAIAFGLQDSAKAPGTAGEQNVLYPDVRPDTDLKLDIAPGGVKETIVLRSADAPSSFVFPLQLEGLTAQVTGGQVIFTDAAGRTRAVIPAGSMTDSGAKPQTSTGVTYRVISSGGTPALQVTADPGWLHDKARTYPVKIDPSVFTSVAGSGISVSDSGASSGAQDLTIGARSAAYLSFPQLEEKLKYHRIFGAWLSLVNYDSATCRSRPVTVNPVTEAWAGKSGLAYPGPNTSSPVARSSFSYGYIATGSTKSACPPKKAQLIDLGKGGRDLVQRWVNGDQPDYGLSVRDGSSDGLGYKKFTGYDTANPPRLFVTHSAYNASYSITDPVPNPPVTQAQNGKIKIAVKNLGAETWTPSTYYLGYRVYDTKGKIVTQQRSANLTQDVARGAKVKLDATIKPLKPGTYSIDFTMVHTGGPVFIDEQVPPVRLIIKIIDIPPVLQGLYPENGYQAPTLTPELWATAVDLDAPTGSTLQYKFEVCERQPDGSAANCFDSGYSTAWAWTVPAGKLSWSRAYLWRVFVKDTGSEVPSPRVALLASVPQPVVTSKLADATQDSQGRDFNPQVGNYSSSALDASVASVGPELSVERTYNSLDPRRDAAFGAGWSTRYDMKLVEDQDGSGNVVVTYPDGRQVRFGKNPDGSYAPPDGHQAILTSDSANSWKLVDKTGTAYQFSYGRLSKISDAAGHSVTLTYDTSNGKLSKVSAQPGTRALSFTWNGGHVATVSTDPVNGKALTWVYTYSGDLLKTVCAPGNRCTSYDYGQGSHYRSVVLDSQPESYYRLGEDDGSAANSEIAVNLGKDRGTYKNVTLGATGAITGVNDTAGTFNGNTSYVALPNGAVKKSRDLAVEVWFKTIATGLGGPLIGYQDKSLDSTSTLGVPALYVGTDGKLRGQFWSGAISPITSLVAVNDGKWHHAVLSAMGSTQNLYLDGKSIGTLTGQTPGHSTLTYDQIGAAYATTPGSWPGWGSSPKRFFAGTIDETAIYQHPLGPEAVAAHYREALRTSDQVTKVTLPNGTTAAEIDYDTEADRVSEYTDQDGGTWKIKKPVVYGDDTNLRRAVEVSDPADHPYLYEYDALTGAMVRLGMPTGLGARDDEPSDSPSPTPSPTYTCTSPDPGDPTFCTTLPPGTGDEPDFVRHDLDGMALRTYDYDDDGYLSLVTNENGDSINFGYDQRGNITSRTTCRAKGDCHTAYSTYPATVTNLADPRNDRPLETRDARSTSATDNRYKTAYTYTTMGNLATQANPDGGLIKYTYTNGTEPATGGGQMPAGLLLTAADARSATTRYAYYSNGDLAQITDPSDLVTKYTYDELGRRASQTVVSDSVPGGATTSYGYDELSRMTSVIYPAAKNAVTGTAQQLRTDSAYDDDGNLLRLQSSDTAPDAVPRVATFDYDDHDRVEKVTDPEGNETDYDYDRSGNVTAMVDGNQNRYEYRYTARNMIAEVRLRDYDGDPDGAPDTGDYLVLHSYAYDWAGRQVRDTDAMGREIDYAYYGDDLLKNVTLKGFHNPDGTKRDYVLQALEYDGDGNPAKETTGNGTTITQNEFDESGQLKATTLDPGGLNRRTAYAYDHAGNVTQLAWSGLASNVTWPMPTAAQTVGYEYDAAERLSKQTEINGTDTRVTTYGYDQRGLTTSITDPRGNVAGADKTAFTTNVDYDELGRPVKTTGPPVAAESNGGAPGTVRPESVTGYSAFDEQTEAKDPLGNINRIEYDKLGRIVKATAPSYTPPGSTTPLTPTTRFKYDALGNTTEVIDPRDNTSRYTYDRLNHVSAADEPAKDDDDRAKTRYTHTRTGQLLSVTGPLGARLEATYDDLDRQVTTTQVERYPNAENYITRNSYDDADNLVGTARPSGATAVNVYDKVGELTKATDPAGTVAQYGYDFGGRQVRVSDGLGRTTRSDYDLFGQLVDQADLDPKGNELRRAKYAYDPAGNPTEATDALHHTTTFGYDAANQLTRQVEPVTDNSSITTTFGYDAAGDRTRFTDGRGNSTVYTVNSLGLPEAVIEPATSATPNAADRTWTASYDKAGNPFKLTAPGGVTQERTFDANGRVLQETGTGAEAPTADRIRSYDQAGRLTEVNAGNDKNTYTYNDRDLLLSADGPSGKAGYTYNPDGQVTSRTDGAGTSSFGYAKGRLNAAQDGITGLTRTIGYDDAGQLDQIDYGAGRTLTVGYDDLSRPKSDTLKNAAGNTVASVSYGYDDNDNTTSKTTVGTAGAGENTYTYDQANRLTSWKQGDKTTAYAWDDSGNRTKAGDRSATFDERNRRITDGPDAYTYTPRGTVASKTTDGKQEKFDFDAFDRLIADDATHYTYDGLDRPADRNGTAFSYAGLSAAPVTDGTSRYARGPDDGVLATGQGSDARIPLTDDHGDLIGDFSPTADLNALTSSTAYDPFGQVTAASGTRSNLGFQGAWTDPDTGNVNMGARWYDPSQGSFSSRDSWSLDPSPASVSANRYTYGDGDPLDNSDPTGHNPCDARMTTLSSGCGDNGGYWCSKYGISYPCSSTPPSPCMLMSTDGCGGGGGGGNPGSGGGGSNGGSTGGGGGQVHRGPSPAELARRRTEAARRQAAYAAKHHAFGINKKARLPHFADPREKVSKNPRQPAAKTSQTHNVVRDTSASLNAIHANAVKAAGPVVSNLSLASQAPPEITPTSAMDSGSGSTPASVPYFDGEPPRWAKTDVRPYNVEKPSSRDREVQSKLGLVVVGGVVSGKAPAASYLLNHWLDNSGSPVVTDPKALMARSPSMNSLVKSLVEAHKGELAFDTGWKSTRFNERENLDLYYAFNGYQVRVSGGSYSTDGKTVYQTYRVDFYKRYNFGTKEEGRRPVNFPLVGQIPQEDISHLHTSGVARDFDVYGSVTITRRVDGVDPGSVYWPWR
ncbi:DUF6531 domain-containing protein [Actinoallomurus purpureus]|uniref:LamG-like jellyroll fold domain-containing protein n=1 Tax=Actinoallomurus purpureus TaxID=478114 RepID=UPI002093AFDE|nr:LamG-like jellyroll fold domain-containing protein [Actinoallomurus purpureus]MCO6006184.1 DUF6531 domain-containing protein [Actinoallomurus purpureus]